MLKHPIHNIQGVKQCDPSVLHDTVEAVERVRAGVSERDPCDDAWKWRACRGKGGASPSIATSSNDASDCKDTCGDRGDRGCGVRNVVRAPSLVWRSGHIACGRCAVHAPGARRRHRRTTGWLVWMCGVSLRGFFAACTGVQISISQKGEGGGGCVFGCVAGGVSILIPVHGAGERGCVSSVSSHPHSDSSSCSGGSSSYVEQGRMEIRLNRRGDLRHPISQVVRPAVSFHPHV